MAPWSRASRVLTFTVNRVAVSSGFDGEDWARLAHLRDRFDPERRLVANHRV
jgi:FAD/FMN-containing dehydrogenase